ncbi:recombinase-like helix-turn-helix domain-containing protein [Variovorax sp. HJSM1_2]|uniref:recombinase-like helix-turn-helix domain-containing protein n=1 Tax=Variovorax sp. HJSM1_2 TaxID=3366263 RepID=UPI003BC09CC2
MSNAPTDRYLEPHQARRREPTTFEDLLGDAIERAFAQGAHTLPELVACLNRTGPSAENGEPWTEQSYQDLMARLSK